MRNPKRGKSFLFRVSTFLIATLVFQCALFAAFLFQGGVLNQLDQNAVDIFDEQISNRTNYLENDMLQRWSELEWTQNMVEATVSDFLAVQGLTTADLIPNSDQTVDLLARLADPLISTMRRNSVNGAFVVFNGPDALAAPADGSVLNKACLYLRDMDPTSISSTNADLLLKRCSADLVDRLGLTMDINWAPTLSVDRDADTFYAPITAAAENPGASLQDLGYWSPPHILKNDQTTVITYSQPLLDAQGLPYGVMGIELSVDYLRQQLPYTELSGGSNGAYLLAIADEASMSGDQPITFRTVSTSGPTARWIFGESGTFQLDSRKVYGDLHMAIPAQGHNAGDVYCSVRYLNLYNVNAPFETQHWALVAAIQGGDLLAFTAHVRSQMVFLTLSTLILGITISLIAGVSFTRPLRTLARKVRTLDPSKPVYLEPTRILEIDDLSSAIEGLSHDVAESSSRLSRIVRMAHVPLAAFQLSLSHNFLYYTEDFYSLLGLPSPEIPPDVPAFLELLQSLSMCVEEKSGDGEAAILYLTDLVTGAPRWVQIQVTQEGGDLVLGALVDVTESRLERRRIEYERDHDLLTSLLNRRAFYAHLEKLTQKPGALGVGAMMMLDLDNLKSINDTYGHDYGDEYIRGAANVLRRFSADRCVVARISGDEFYLFFSGYTSRAELQQVIDRLQEAFTSTSILLPSGESCRLRASAGVAWYPDDSTVLEELVRFADFAMYEAKHSLKGTIRDFDLQAYHENSFLLYNNAELDRILETQAVDFVFQPLVDCSNGMIMGYEGLMRPRSTILSSPQDLLRIARTQSKLHQVEWLTWCRGIEAFDALSDKAEGALIFLNSIPSQSMTPEETAIYDARFGPYLERTVIELTENDEMNDTANAAKFQRCRQYHQKVALDDFGTGYSNDALLLSIQPQYVKMDMSIVRNIDQDENRQAIFRNLVGLCRSMGIKVIAEGVETAEEMRAVVGLGADYLQGYYLSRPKLQPTPPSEEVLAQLREAWLQSGR